MESPTSICDAEIPLQLHKIDAFTASYRKTLESVRATAKETARSQVKLEEVKGKLREAEDDLVKALRVKTCKEARRMALMDAIVSAKARVEDLKRSIQEQRTKKEDYATFISQQSLALAASKGTLNESIENEDETQEAICWYNKVLGFHVEGGHGVKFAFKNINVNNSNEEYFFTIRHESNIYTLLRCEPSLEDTKKLIQELNMTNGLFKFVKDMRKKFQEAAAQALTTGEHQESAFISASAPVLSVSFGRSDSPTKENEHEVELTEGNTSLKKQNVKRRVKLAVTSPGSSVRRSARLMENEHEVEPTENNTSLKKQSIKRRAAVTSPGSASSVRQSPRLMVRNSSGLNH